MLDGEKHAEYLLDEARIAGRADSLSMPTSEGEALEILAGLIDAGVAITQQGARTGAACGAIPDGGALVNMSAMQRVLGLRREGGELLLRVEPGVTLEQLNRQLAAKRFDSADWDDESLDILTEMRRDAFHYMFPPNPSETAATLGGVAACNASGSHVLGYGEARDWVQGVRVALADGSLYDSRDAPNAAVAEALTVAHGRETPPAGAGGYAVGPGVTPVDLFCGSEGSLGTLLELTLRLAPAPAHRWGVLAFFDSATALLDFFNVADLTRNDSACLVAAEFFHSSALKILAEGRASLPALSALPVLPACDCALFVELAGDDEPALMDKLEEMLMALDEGGHHADEALAATTAKDFERLSGLSHGLVEAINFKAAGEGTSPQALDVLLPRGDYGRWVERLATLQTPHSLHGSIGYGHLHLQLFGEAASATLPVLLEELAAGAALPAAAYGCGRLKTEAFVKLAGRGKMEAMASIKAALDFQALLQPGVFFR